MKYVQFENKIRDNIVKDVNRQNFAPSFGMVAEYDRETNTATVVTARPGSNQMGEIYRNVPCPVTVGVQAVAPELGKPCQLTFPNGTQGAPMISQFFNHDFRKYEYVRHYEAVVDTPRFLMEL